MHLVVDGYGADPAMLKDPDAIYRFLDRYPDAIGMTKITPPHVYEYVGQTPEDVGISGFVLIAESHISVHTFPRRGYVNIDVFSCKEFDTERALQELCAIFSLEKVRSWNLDRGLEYSDPAIARAVVNAKRAVLAEGILGRETVRESGDPENGQMPSGRRAASSTWLRKSAL